MKEGPPAEPAGLQTWTFQWSERLLGFWTVVLSVELETHPQRVKTHLTLFWNGRPLRTNGRQLPNR